MSYDPWFIWQAVRHLFEKPRRPAAAVGRP